MPPCAIWTDVAGMVAFHGKHEGVLIVCLKKESPRARQEIGLRKKQK